MPINWPATKPFAKNKAQNTPMIDAIIVSASLLNIMPTVRMQMGLIINKINSKTDQPLNIFFIMLKLYHNKS